MNETNNKGNVVLLTIVGIATLLVALIGATFAFFSAVITPAEAGEAETIELTAGSLSLTLDGGAKIEVPGTGGTGAIYPRDESWGEKNFTITANLSAAVKVPYTITLQHLSTSLKPNEEMIDDNALTYTLEDSGSTATIPTECNSYYKNFDNKAYITPSTEQNIMVCSFQGPMTANNVHSFKFKVYFPNDQLNPQNDLQGKVYYGKLIITTTEQEGGAA